MEMNPLISVIIPCYNLGDYLDACLKSILRQKVGDAEYIFVNDGSTDDTLKKLEQFVQNKAYCKLINQPNKGVSAARNAALEISTGEYIYLLDGDDILTDNAIEQMIAEVSDDKPGIVISKAQRLAGENVTPIPYPFKTGIYSPKELYNSIRFFHPATQLLYRRDIIILHNIRFDTAMRLGEVYDFTLHCFQFVDAIKVVTGCYFRYVVRLESATRNPIYSRDFTILDSIKKYNTEAGPLVLLPSFKYTNFKILISFTYTKYLKLRLKSQETHEAIKRLLNDSYARQCIKCIPFLKSVPLRDRLLSAYMLTTGSLGYKLLVRLLGKK